MYAALLLCATLTVAAPTETLFQAEPVPVTGFSELIEGPSCDAAGNVYAVAYLKPENIGRVTPDNKVEVFLTLPNHSFGNGIVFDPSGMMYVADYVGHNVFKIDPTDEADCRLRPRGQDEPAERPGHRARWHALRQRSQVEERDRAGLADRRRKAELSLLAGEMGTTNGIDVSPDGKTLYVNESVQRNIWAFDLTADKPEKKLFKKFDDFGFDGMRCDVDGNLYITRYGKGTVAKISPAG